MDIQNFVNFMNNQAKIESGREYNLGNFIEDLRKYKNEFLLVEFDDGSIPTEFDSWRGSYCELSLGYTKKEQCYSSDLFRKAFNANGSIFEGYKGGEFLMDLTTPIHQANYGECGVTNENDDYNHKKIIGVKEENNKIIIITRIDED